MTLLYHQKDFDIIVTNTLIMDNFLETPSAHTILNKAMINGFALYPLPKGKGKSKRALIASTVGLSGIPYFSEGKVKNFTQIFGTFILGHELGHMIFYLYDVYNHPLTCLMNSAPETLKYNIGLKYYLSHVGPCELCRNRLIDIKWAYLKAKNKKKK